MCLSVAAAPCWNISWVDLLIDSSISGCVVVLGLGLCWRQWGIVWFCLGVTQGATLGPLCFSDFLSVVWALETSHCVCACIQCVCQCYPWAAALFRCVYIHTEFPARLKPEARPSDRPPLDVPPAAPPPLCVCVCLRGSSAHDPTTQHWQRAEYQHTHPDNHTRLITIITTKQNLKRPDTRKSPMDPQQQKWTLWIQFDGSKSKDFYLVTQQ